VNDEPRGIGAREREQLQALALANAVRLAIADVRVEVKSGSLSVRAALDDERAAHSALRALVGPHRLAGPVWRAMPSFPLTGLCNSHAESGRLDRRRDRDRLGRGPVVTHDAVCASATADGGERGPVD
jgi:hypothetical protein